jgi:hypothetical protein
VALGKDFFLKILCRVSLCVALGKEKKFFENCLLSALCVALGKEFFLKILCRVPLCLTLGKEIIF